MEKFSNISYCKTHYFLSFWLIKICHHLLHERSHTPLTTPHQPHRQPAELLSPSQRLEAADSLRSSRVDVAVTRPPQQSKHTWPNCSSLKDATTSSLVPCQVSDAFFAGFILKCSAVSWYHSSDGIRQPTRDDQAVVHAERVSKTADCCAS